MRSAGPRGGPVCASMDDDRKLPRFQPGPAIAAAVLVAALLALALIDRSPGSGPSSPPAAGDGPAVQLLPQGGPDAGRAQCGSGLHGRALAGGDAAR
jgi:hypothetical protein